MHCGKELTIIKNYSIFENDYNQIKQNKILSPELRKIYDHVAASKAKTDDKISSLLRHWKEGRQSANTSPLGKIKPDPIIAQKAYKIHLAMKVAGIAAILLGAAAIITPPIAAGIYCSAHFAYGLTAFLHALVPFAGPLPPFVTPPAVLMLGISSGACAGGSLLFYLPYLILDNSKTIREERVQKNKNFQEFVANYLEKNLKFIPRYEDLTDQGLHSIYSEWKNRMQNLPMVCLRSKDAGSSIS